MNEYSFRFLKERVSIERVLAEHGLLSGLSRKNDRLTGPCPLHGGDNPTAFRVHLQKGLWRCFTACGGGDTVELVRRIHGCSYAQAARHLSRLAEGPSAKPASLAPISHGRSSFFRPFTRSIPLNPRTPFLQDIKRTSVHTALHFEAGTTQSSPFLKNTVAVRLHDMAGNPLGYCGRLLLADQINRFGKWRFPKYFPKAHVLYNAHRARQFRGWGIIVVECPWAAMRISQAGFPNTVALLGTQLFDHQIAWISKAPTVLLMLDADPPGRDASLRIASLLKPFTTVYTHHLEQAVEPEDLSDRALDRIIANYPVSF